MRALLKRAAAGTGALASVLGLSTVMSAPPASAASALCTTYGAYCAATAQITQGSAVYDAYTGIGVSITDVSGSTYRLEAGSGLCLGWDSTVGFVDLLPCSGTFGVNWTLSMHNGNYRFYNSYLARQGYTEYLSSPDSLGHYWEVEPLGQNGWYQQFY